MDKEEARELKEGIISDVDDLVTGGACTLEEIVGEIEDTLCHLTK